jgi:class 3 adenylate cyclase
MSQTRSLAAILAADVAGYSRLIGADKGGTLQAFKAIRAELFDPAIAAHTAGWSRRRVTASLVEFSSVVTAPMLRDRAASRDSPTPRMAAVGINVHDAETAISSSMA